MTMSALIVVRLAERVMGLTASERFKAVQKLDSGGNFMTSKVFTVAMVLVLAGSIIAFLVVTLLRKAREKQAAEAARPAPSQTATTQNGRGPAAAKNNRPTGTNTGQNVNSVSKKADSAPAAEKPVAGSSTRLAEGYQAFIAIFPFVKKIDLSAPAQSVVAGGLFQFMPAKVVNVVDRVVSVETTLPANVGDRVLVAIEADGADKGTEAKELIEDTGVVQQSVQPADSIDAPGSRRLAIVLAGLSVEQIARIAGVVGGAKAKQTNGAEEKVK